MRKKSSSKKRKKTSQKSREHRAADRPLVSELVFVVDVGRFTGEGFVGTSEYEGEPIEIEFGQDDSGVRLLSEMTERLGVRKGEKVTVEVDAGDSKLHQSIVSGVGKTVRFSDPMIYGSIGSAGGAILRVRRS